VYAENAEHYKNNQLQELDNLANAIAVLRSNANFKDSDKLNDLNNVISEPINGPLNESIDKISGVFRKYATDYKLRKNLKHFVENNATIEPIAEVKEQKPEPVSEKPKVEQI